MRRDRALEPTPQARRHNAGDPTGDSVAAFRAVLEGMPLLDSDRVDALAAELSREAQASAAPTGVASAGRQSKPLPPRWRRRAVFGTLLSSVAVKIALAAAAFAATTGGLAATGNLPDPAQQVLSEVGERIGIHLPAPDRQATTGKPQGVTMGDEGIEPETTGVLEGLTEVDRQDGPELPDDVAETARSVVEAVVEGDPVVEGLAFGARVAEAASGGRAGGPPEDAGPPGGSSPPGQGDVPPGQGNGPENQAP